jgi:hypothetical protein
MMAQVVKEEPNSKGGSQGYIRKDLRRAAYQLVTATIIWGKEHSPSDARAAERKFAAELSSYDWQVKISAESDG